MAPEHIDRRGQGSAPRAKSRRRWSRLALAILGMILSVVAAVGIVMQEQGQIVRVGHHGHLYSPFLRRLLRHKESQPPTSGSLNQDPATDSPAPVAPSGN